MDYGAITPLPAKFKPIDASSSSCCTFKSEYTVSGDGAAGSSPDSDTIIDIHQAMNRYNDFFRHLQDAIIDVEDVRRENLQISAENLQLSFLISELEDLLRENDSDEENDSLIDDDGGEKKAAPVPKSIAIRSTEFLTMNNTFPVDGKHPHRIRISSSQAATATATAGSESAVEVDVYGQGSWKTELCNKWSACDGQCPYGNRCQFAHGMAELRPVIRHPRYKTQLCRMLSNPGGCPYGHRCHFRHSLPS